MNIEKRIENLEKILQKSGELPSDQIMQGYHEDKDKPEIVKRLHKKYGPFAEESILWCRLAPFGKGYISVTHPCTTGNDEDLQ